MLAMKPQPVLVGRAVVPRTEAAMEVVVERAVLLAVLVVRWDAVADHSEAAALEVVTVAGSVVDSVVDSDAVQWDAALWDVDQWVTGRVSSGDLD